jgi:sugar (pentulose or hexulose) kinase
VRVLPYLAPSGERAPFVEPAARGQFSGLQLSTGRADLIRAMCEGIAFAARDCFEAAGLSGQLFVCGGGTRSPAWLQIFADVLGRPLHIARSPEVGARGAVLSGLAAIGRAQDLAAWTGPEGKIEPRRGATEHYDDLFAEYRQIQAEARGAWGRR